MTCSNRGKVRIAVRLIFPLVVIPLERECASDWSKVGYQEGELGATGMAERHASHCASFEAEKYKEGYQKGFAGRARPPV